MAVIMFDILRAIFVLLALAYSTSADEYVSSTTLCLFKGHPKHSVSENVFWLEEIYNQYPMPFYDMSELGYSELKNVKVTLSNGSKGDALIYLYHNMETESENVTFVNYDKSAYHFSGSEVLDKEKFRVVGGGKMVVEFGSCATPQYHWEYEVASTSTPATISGYVRRNKVNP
ncbi:hypothetical protein V1527DRAFT_455295 [Lipomyces starkeyi]